MAARSTALRSCVVATTGLDENAVRNIKSVVLAGGGSFSARLTAKVTHLIADAAGSPKHRIASASGHIQVVKPSWVAACTGLIGDGPPAAFAHLLLPLIGFRLSITGFQGAERNEMQFLATSAGATYYKDLSRDCTHLIAASPEGRKYEFAMSVPGMHVVRGEWLRLTFSSKVLQDENSFSLDSAKATVAAASTAPTAITSLANATTGDTAVPNTTEGNGYSIPPNEEHSRPQLTNSSLLPLDEVVDDPTGLYPHICPSLALEEVCLYLVPSVADANPATIRKCTAIKRLAALAGAMISPNWSPSVSNAIVVSVPVASGQVAAMKRAESRGVVIVDIDWLSHSASAGAFLAPEDYPPPAWATAPSSNPFLDPSSSLGPRDQTSTLGGSLSLSGPVSASATSHVFQGVRLALGPLAMRHADLCGAISAKVLAGRGKVLTHDTTGQVTSGVPTHVVCPAGMSTGELAVVQGMREKNPRLELVTHAWIEFCLGEQRLLSVSSCALFAAREYELPLRTFVQKNIVIAMSGFMSKPPDPDRNRRRVVLSQLATLLGAKYSERMKRNQATHLIVENANGTGSEKIKRALEWQIPVVSEKWLLACASAGALVAPDPYLVTVSLMRDASFRGSNGSLSAAAGNAPANAKQESRPPSMMQPPASMPVSRVGRRASAPGRSAGVVAGGQDGTPYTSSATLRKRRLSMPVAEEDSARRKSTRRKGMAEVSAEDLVKRLTDNLERLTDANHQSDSIDGIRDGCGSGGAGSEGGGFGGDGGDSAMESEGTLAANAKYRRRGQSGQPDRTIATPVMVHGSDWSLEASQSQMIVHKDLTPPPVRVPITNEPPPLRTMPSRAAKARQVSDLARL
jgi:twin BRCT domain